MGVGTKTKRRCVRRSLPKLAAVCVALSAITLQSTIAGASNRQTIAATTTAGNAGVLLALGVSVIVLGGIGFAGFTWMRRKRRPNECAEQREALELAERAVRYWQGARAHLEAAEAERMRAGVGANEDETHGSLVANAIDGLKNAIHQRDQCQMDLIRCMAAGSAATVPMSMASDSQPFFMPREVGSPPPGTSTLDEP